MLCADLKPQFEEPAFQNASIGAARRCGGRKGGTVLCGLFLDTKEQPHTKFLSEQHRSSASLKSSLLRLIPQCIINIHPPVLLGQA
jgi:hypothetical protein